MSNIDPDSANWDRDRRRNIGYMIRRADGTEVGPFFTPEEAKHYLQPGDVPFAYNSRGDVIDPVVDCPVCGDDAEHASAPGPNEPVDEYDCLHCGHQFRRPPTPTVDDVLAALVADQVTTVKTETWGGPGHEARTFVTVKRGGVKTEHSAPTLRAALIHAALAASLAGVVDA